MTGEQRLWGLQHPTAEASEPVILSPDSRRRAIRLGAYTFAAVAILNIVWTVLTDTSTDDARFWIGIEVSLVLALTAQLLPNPRMRAFGRGVGYCALSLLIVGGLGFVLLWSITGAGGS